MDDAYAIQNALYRAKLGTGRHVVGWKIGLTSKAMQYALNIDIPDSGICLMIWCLIVEAPCQKGALSSRVSKRKLPL